MFFTFYYVLYLLLPFFIRDGLDTTLGGQMFKMAALRPKSIMVAHKTKQIHTFTIQFNNQFSKNNTFHLAMHARAM